MLRQRLLSGFGLALVGIILVILDARLEMAGYYQRWLGWPARGVIICLLAAALAIIGIREFYALSRAVGFRPFRLVGAVVSVYLILETCGPGLPQNALWPRFGRVDFTLFVVACGLAAAFMLQVARWSTKGAFGNIGVTLLGAIYIGLLGSFVVRIRQMSWQPNYDIALGAHHLALYVTTIKVTDICAFFCGILTLFF